VKIDFAIAGFQKCGTTSLHYYLEQQEDVFMPKEKEMYYYTNLSESNKREAYKDSFFEEYKGEKLIGFSDVDLIMSKEALSRFKQANPNAKLIIMIREPLKRTVSAYNFEYSKCLEDKDDINLAIINDLETDRFGYISRSLYYKNIQNAKTFFNDSELLILRMEDFKNDKELMFQKISRFLNCNIHNIEDKKYNETGSPKFKFLQKVLWNQDNLIHKVFSLFPRSFKKTIKIHVKSKLLALNSSVKNKRKSQLIDSNIYKEYLESDNDKLLSDFGTGYEHRK
jgi:hypothetical protein